MEGKQEEQVLPSDFRHIVRIANTDIGGKRPIFMGLCKIKGVNFMFSNMVCKLAGIDKTKITGSLTDQEIESINKVLAQPLAAGCPVWMANRQKDSETGEHKHLVSSDLTFAQDNDIKMMKKMKSYRGVRHILGQPVRGQRTKSHFRKNKGKVSLGVKRRPDAKSGKT